MVRMNFSMRRKPRLLLINPWIYDFTAYDLWSKPVGLLYVAAFLRKIGYEIDWVDCLDKYHPELLKLQGRTRPRVKKYGVGPFYRQRIPKPEILSFLPQHFARYGVTEEIFRSELQKSDAPDAVLVTSLMTYWYPGPRRVVEIVREIFPSVPVILGGVYATLMPEHALRVVQPDYLIQGPGEIQAAQLLQDILPNGCAIETLPENLDDFPPPAFDLYRKLDYLVVMTSRGCPYHCTFCATHQISGPFVQRKVERVVEEIVEQARRFRVRDIAFYDDALLLNKHRHIIPILELLAERALPLRFHTPNGLHARQIDETLARLFYRVGFKTIRLSFETVNPERFNDIANKVTPGDLEMAVEHLEAAGYQRKELEAYVIMGLPDQSLQEVYESMLFVHGLGLKIRLASFSPIPGTVDYQRAVDGGLLPPDLDPLLTNKTVYPLYRNEEAYWRFHRVRQVGQVLNQAIDRGVNFFRHREFRDALESFLLKREDEPLLGKMDHE